MRSTALVPVPSVRSVGVLTLDPTTNVDIQKSSFVASGRWWVGSARRTGVIDATAAECVPGERRLRCRRDVIGLDESAPHDSSVLYGAARCTTVMAHHGAVCVWCGGGT